MTKRILLAAGLAAVLAPTQATAFTGVQYARFTATITGVQTNSWSSTGPSYSDCNGTQTMTGKGTEVFRFASARPHKVMFQRNGGGVQVHMGTWDPSRPEDPLGLFSTARLTRQGAYTTSWTGGWCGHPADVVTPDDSDCGGRKGFAAVGLEPEGRRVKVDVSPSGFLTPFKNCPIEGPDGVTIDSEGCLWNARYQGSCVARITPEGRRKLRASGFAPGKA